MNERCQDCKYAEWDYEEYYAYYNSVSREWFVCGCKIDCNPEDCNEFSWREEDE